MASTACSEAWLALYLHAKSFSVSKALAAHVTAPLSSCAVPPQSQLGYFDIFDSGWLLGCLEFKMDTNSLEWNERPRVVSFHSNRSNVPTRSKEVKTLYVAHSLLVPGIRLYAHLGYHTIKTHAYVLLSVLEKKDSCVYYTVVVVCIFYTLVLRSSTKQKVNKKKGEKYVRKKIKRAGIHI